MKTGEPTGRHQRIKLASAPPWAYFFLLAGLLPGAIAVAITQRTAKGFVPLRRSRLVVFRSLRSMGMVTLILSAVWMGLAAAVDLPFIWPVLLFAMGFALFGCGRILGVRGSVLEGSQTIRFFGVHPVFVEALELARLSERPVVAPHSPVDMPADPFAGPVFGVAPAPGSTVSSAIPIREDVPGFPGMPKPPENASPGSSRVVQILVGVAVSVISIVFLLAIAVPTYLGAQDRARQRQAETQATTVAPVEQNNEFGTDQVETVPEGLWLPEIGDCVDLSADGPVVQVDCEGDQHFEVFSLVEMPRSGDGSYPGDQAARTFAEKVCTAEFMQEYGPVPEPDLSFNFRYPVAKYWDVGGRLVVCLSFSDQGT